MNRSQTVLLVAAIITFLIFIPVHAQTEEMTLKLSRDWGYGGFNGDIQGLFSMKATGPADLTKVEFYIDDVKFGEIERAPYIWQFNTDNFSLGKHNLYALGYALNVQKYKSNIIPRNFVPASEGTKSAMKFVMPIVVILFGFILLSFVIPLVTTRGKILELPLGAGRIYKFGGGICPKCSRPFSFQALSMNLGFSKLARCPYCGKWSPVRIQPLAKLREAEDAEMQWGKSQVKEETEEEKLHKELDDSKYQ
jgi:hypothetical protein